MMFKPIRKKSVSILSILVNILQSKKRAIIPLILLITIVLFNWKTVFSTSAEESFDSLNTDVTPTYHKLKSKTKFLTGTLNDKCAIYFDEIHNGEKVWNSDISFHRNFKVDTLLYNRKKWLSTKYREKKKLLKEGQKLTEADREVERKSYDQQLRDLYIYELKLKEDMTRSRVFGQCFLKDDVSKEDSSVKMDQYCSMNEHRVYPWLSGKLPTYTSSENENAIKLPVYEDNSIVNSKCFLKTFKQLVNGKGIVIPVFDFTESLGDVKGLIRVLRGLKTSMPVQIIHKGDLAGDIRDELIELAKYSQEYKSLGSIPELEIWFTDVSPMIQSRYADLLKDTIFFHLIATVFNSFEEVVVIKPDVIPLINPEAMFQAFSFKNSGSLFFKKRSGLSRKKFEGFIRVSSIIKGLFPTKYDYEYFTIKSVERRHNENRFLRNEHDEYMDSSVIVFSKNKLFSGFLSSINLSLYDIVRMRVSFHSDADYYWLGQNIDGNNQYSFNKNFAVSVGIKTPENNKPEFCTISQEICSQNFGQIDDNDRTLFFIKNNKKKCDNDDKFINFLTEKYRTNTASDRLISQLQNNPAKIDSVLVTPTISEPVYSGLNEPLVSWKQMQICNNEMWCGYDILGRTDDIRTRGFTIDYNDYEMKTFENLGNLWLNRTF